MSRVAYRKCVKLHCKVLPPDMRQKVNMQRYFALTGTFTLYKELMHWT
jgi:hypothetical protein